MKKRLQKITAILVMTVMVLSFTINALAFNVSGLVVSTSANNSWTVGDDSATASGAAFLFWSTNSGELKLTAQSAGTISFDYTLGTNTYIVINGSTYTSSGSYSDQLSAGDYVTIVGWFTGSQSTVSVDNIAFSTQTQYLTVYVSENDDLASAIASVSGTDVIGKVIVQGAVTVDTALTIPANVTVVAAYNANDTGDGTSDYNHNGAVTNSNNTYYGKITVSSNGSLTVYGTLIISGQQQSTQPKSGYLSGNYGMLELNGPMSIENGGVLYARGIVDGTSTVTAKNGSSVYQLFQIADWRGGTAASSAYYNVNSVFPFSRYEINSIRTTTTYMNGAQLFGQYYIYAGGSGYYGNVLMIGEGGLLEFTDSTASTENIIFSSIIGTNEIYTSVSINGSVQTGDISVTAAGMTISSSGMTLPFGYNMNITIANGAALYVANSIKLLPEFNLTVEAGGTLEIDDGAELFFYAVNDYSNTFSYNYTWYPILDATLTVETGATVNYNGLYGRIATSDDTGSNLDLPWPSVPDTTTVYEYANNTTVTGVTFYFA